MWVVWYWGKNQECTATLGVVGRHGWAPELQLSKENPLFCIELLDYVSSGCTRHGA